MNTNQFWNTENIKAVASLWPLALIIFLILVVFVVLIFFLPQTRKFLSGLNNLRLKIWQGEIAVNQPSTTPPKPDEESNVQEAATGAPKTERKEEVPSNVKNEPELDLDSEHGMYYYLFTGKLDDAEKVFQKLQSTTNDPEERVRREAAYLRQRFEKGDLSAQDRLHQLETRLKEGKSTLLGVVQRMDAFCYVSSRDYAKAVERFKGSADSCVTEAGRATSLGFAAAYLYKSTKKEEAFRLLKGAINTIQDSQAKVSLLTDLANLYENEKDNFNRVLALQRALSFQPNSKDLLFKTAYACSEADFHELAVLHYEKLVQIDSSQKSALNNLGVAFDKLQIPSLAVKNYKRAIDNDETLAAAKLYPIKMNLALVALNLFGLNLKTKNSGFQER
jgi:tetratricopeptide (TPR) repeat protein